jgi:hypothetical protein
MLLPKIDGYTIYRNRYIDNYQFEDYKIGLNFSFPFFWKKNAEAWN